jgi:hypothetical protein
VRCEKSGYHAEIEFHTKPLFGGKPHKISGSFYRPGTKKPFMTLRGEWNGVIFAKHGLGEEYLFTDVRAKPEVKKVLFKFLILNERSLKECDPISKQGPRESRRLWRHVTAALFRNRINIASSSKRWIEQRQRDEVKQRLELGTYHQQRFFHKIDHENWRFVSDLKDRATI